jgi:hypothetical protein
MITQITKTDNGYEIILDGQTLSVPEAGGNRHFIRHFITQHTRSYDHENVYKIILNRRQINE